MKKRICITLFSIITGGFLPVSTLWAQGWKLMTREEIEAKVHPEVLKQTILQFDSCRLNIGNMAETDEPRTVVFHFRNVSNKAVTLTKVNTSCGCTVAKFSKETVAPQATGTLSLTYNPKNRPGTIDAQALVYTDVSEQSPVAKLSLCGYVSGTDEWNHLPQSMGYLRLSRKQVIFRQPKGTVIERIVCGNSGNQPLQPKVLLAPSCLDLRTEPAELAAVQEGELVITLHTDKLAPNPATERRLSIILDGIGGKPSERTIEVIVKP